VIPWQTVPGAVASVRAVQESAATAFVALSVLAQSLPEWVNEQLFRWITNNGLATVFVILVLGVIVAPLLALLRYVIQDAVGHFNTRLDNAQLEQSAGFREMSAVITHLDGTLDRLADQSAANHEALSNLLMFVSHTQLEVVAHRGVVEGGGVNVPSPPMTSSRRPEDAVEVQP
jgi:hypothetical protein